MEYHIFRLGNIIITVSNALLVPFIIAVVLGIVSLLMYVIGMCRVFKKAGYPWGYVFVPYYNTYLMMEIAGCKKLLWWYMVPAIFCPASFFIPVLTETMMQVLLWLVSFAAVMALIVYMIILFRLPRAFGKHWTFGLGMLVASPICLMVLGFGSSTHVGYFSPAASRKAKAKKQAPVSWKCPHCGAFSPSFSQACISCGRKKPVEQAAAPDTEQLPAREEAAADASWTCKECGKENQPENKFCAACGKGKNDAPLLSWPCSRCGKENRPENKFCTACGAPKPAPEAAREEKTTED